MLKLPDIDSPDQGRREVVRSRSLLNNNTQQFTVKVLVKIKPHNLHLQRGSDEEESKIATADGNSGYIRNGMERLISLDDSYRDGIIRIGPREGEVTQKHGTFNRIVLPFHSQSRAYQDANIPELLGSFLGGKNCTLFMYGQTGSGKTYSLFGPPYCFSSTVIDVGSETELFEGVSIPRVWGLFPRSALYLLSQLQATLAENPDQCYLNVSAVEVYLNQCYDLLNGKVRVPVAGFGKGAKATAHCNRLLTTNTRDKDGKWIPPWIDGQFNTHDDAGYEAAGQTSRQLRSAEDLLALMQLVDNSRSAKSHALNERSSRSHCIVTLTLPAAARGRGKDPKFLFVDLAGSERPAKTGNDQRAEAGAEARNINTSLSALGRCITALAVQSRKPKGKGREVYIPFRDSVLTMLMKQSLGGTCRTALIVTVAEDPAQIAETVATLKFGKVCAAVRNKADTSPAQGARSADSLRAEIENAQAELASLDHDLDALEASGQGGCLDAGHPKPTRDAFMDNWRRMEQHQATERALQQDEKDLLAAAAASCQGSGGGGGQAEGAGGGGGKLQEVRRRRAYEASQARNLKGILVRQITTGIWVPASKAYARKAAAREGAANRLRRLGAPPVGERPRGALSLTIENLLVDYEGSVW